MTVPKTFGKKKQTKKLQPTTREKGGRNKKTGEKQQEEGKMNGKCILNS